MHKNLQTDDAKQELTDYKDDLRDDVIDYALLGICSIERRRWNVNSYI